MFSSTGVLHAQQTSGANGDGDKKASEEVTKEHEEEYDQIVFDELDNVDEQQMNEIEEAISETEINNEQAAGDANVLVDISAAAAVLMEGSTGEIIYAKNETKELRPASITKIMTLLLIFEALDQGKISLTDSVSVSEHAASMGGSQVYLEPFETQDVNTMIKCISIASANDASVAMAEFIAGSEEAFVKMMNEKAASLGMKNTHFVNCYGLDTDGHYTSALDVARMSRELIMKYPQISNYSTVWMDTIVHTTRKGQTEFGLTNTNKLIKSYQGITGLKTGSTGLAKYCLSATARRDDMDLIAVIMAAPDPKLRFGEAAKLLNYGFANCTIYKDDGADITMPIVKVKKGIAEELKVKVEGTFSHLCTKGVVPSEITREVTINEFVTAPIKENDTVGYVTYYYNQTEIGKVGIVAAENIRQANFADYFLRLLAKYF
ncbi:MAG: D-alanyl-D-alanine carboxypeptidase [Lachnospiraceae bacterium]|nr:D-alanyl-D-alanine carboxypeptidase [Lachnospiraceae bacterium]